MSTPTRMKRRLLKELVAENVDTAAGALPRQLRRRTFWPRVAAVVGLAAATALLVLPGILRPAGTTPVAQALEPLPPPVPTAIPKGPRLPAVETDALPASLRFGTPTPLDPAGLPLAVRRIVLDPGHGGSEDGTHAPGGLVERALTLAIASKLKGLLLARGYEVVMTREDDVSVSLERRAELANGSRADIMVSIHLNWIPNRTKRGIETYYVGPTDDPEVTRLAAAENANSGYSLADMKRLLERIYVDARRNDSRRLAEAVQGALYGSLRQRDSALSNWGVKTAPFIVLVATEMPAILAEVSCLSSDDEAHLLATDSYREQIALALCSGITAFARARSGQTKGTYPS